MTIGYERTRDSTVKRSLDRPVTTCDHRERIDLSNMCVRAFSWWRWIRSPGKSGRQETSSSKHRERWMREE